MVAGTGLNSDGFSANTTWNATAWNQDPNTIRSTVPILPFRAAARATP